MPGGAAAVQGAPPAAATPTITIVSGNQLRVQPATWASGGSSGSGGGGQIAGRQSPSIEAGPFAGADGVAPSLLPPQLPPVAAPSPFQAPGAGFTEDPVGEGQLQRRPSYGTQVRSHLVGALATAFAACKPCSPGWHAHSKSVLEYSDQS